MSQPWIVVDVEADGKIPPLHSMVSFGAVVMESGNARSFYGEVSPISSIWLPDALAASKKTREEHLVMPKPEVTMPAFVNWIKDVAGQERPIFVSDNPAFDWQWMNWYLETYASGNPFGHSARRIGDLFAGFSRDVTKSSAWKKFRKTKHTHHPVDDARGNVEALLAMKDMGLRFPE